MYDVDRSHVQTSTCDLEMCPVDCQLYDWTGWSDCSPGAWRKPPKESKHQSKNQSKLIKVDETWTCYDFLMFLSYLFVFIHSYLSLFVFRVGLK